MATCAAASFATEHDMVNKKHNGSLIDDRKLLILVTSVLAAD